MIKTILVAAALGATLGGCMSTSSPVATVEASTATSTAAFAPMAVSSNLLEIETSRLALQRSRDPQIRRLAQRMIRDHTAASRRMMTVMRSSGLEQPPATLSSRHQAMIDKLAATSAGEFDAAYLAIHAQAHDEAVMLFRTYSQSGDNSRLVAFARETLPKLESHAGHVQTVAQAGT
jgi:putative membrane protein